MRQNVLAQAADVKAAPTCFTEVSCLFYMSTPAAALVMTAVHAVNKTVVHWWLCGRVSDLLIHVAYPIMC